jgi:hypothetical protein
MGGMHTGQVLDICLQQDGIDSASALQGQGLDDPRLLRTVKGRKIDGSITVAGEDLQEGISAVIDRVGVCSW